MNLINTFYPSVIKEIKERPLVAKATLGCALAVLSAYAPVTAGVAAGAYMVSRCLRRRSKPLSQRPPAPIGPFPFYTIACPQQDKPEWIKETGLNPEETQELDKYISENLEEWEKRIDGKEVLRIPKKESGLARTIHVYREYGQLCIQVLCKTKGGLKRLGEGGYKNGKRSVEWRTKTLWGQFVSNTVNYNDIIIASIKNHKSVSAVPSITPCPSGQIVYNKPYRSVSAVGPIRPCSGLLVYNEPYRSVLSFFVPMRAGEVTSKFATIHKYHFVHDMLKAFVELEKNDIYHVDIKLPNILYYQHNNIPYFELNDFDTSTKYAVSIKNVRQWRLERKTGFSQTHFEDYDLSPFISIVKEIDDEGKIAKFFQKFQPESRFYGCMKPLPFTAEEMLKRFEAEFANRL